ncbi:MAG: protein TolR [Legionellales bacterium]|nr:protein TolR [Legionellales bacterium]
MSSRRPRRSVAEINVVPYIDVMLVLLVIFMITAPLLTQGVKVKLPQAAAKELASKSTVPIVVSVDTKGSYFLNIAEHPQQPIQAADLINQVAAALQVDKTEHRDRPVLVKGDADVNYGSVVQAMVLLQQAGAPSVGLMTRPSSLKS